MKSTFSRMFALVSGVIFLCLIFLGLSFRLILSDYLESEKREALHNNALTLTSLATAYEAAGELDYRWGDFHVALTASAQVAGSDMFYCDLDGRILMCSCTEVGCGHRGTQLDPAFMEEIQAQGEAFRQDTLSSLYEDPHFIEGMTVQSPTGEGPIGILLVAAPRTHVTGVLTQTIVLFVYVSVLVLAIAMIACFVLSRNQAISIQAVSKAATRFGHGELDVRVPLGGRNSQEVDELADAFNTMAESLATAENQRREFVANVSHELKTPMTTIAGFMDGMLDGTIPPAQHRHYMQIVSDEVRRLSRLVRSMLDISRMQSQGISETSKRRFDLTETIGQVLISFEQRINRKNLHVDVQMPDRSVWTKAEPDSITQVVYNLTDNAIKFCNQGGLLRIQLEVLGSKAQVLIQNSGPTVSPEELPLLFDRFHKTDKSRSEDREGVGLGLYIVKTILDSHGEDISVTSENGLTTFRFTLPVVR